jgi:hypothetical protein
MSNVSVEVPCDGTATTLIALTLINIFLVAPVPPAGVTLAQMSEEVLKVVLFGALAVGALTPVKNASFNSVILLLLNFVVILLSADPVPNTLNRVFFRVLAVGVGGAQLVPLHLKVDNVLAEIFAGLLKEISGVLLQKIAKSIRAL